MLACVCYSKVEDFKVSESQKTNFSNVQITRLPIISSHSLVWAHFKTRQRWRPRLKSVPKRFHFPACFYSLSRTCVTSNILITHSKWRLFIKFIKMVTERKTRSKWREKQLTPEQLRELFLIKPTHKLYISYTIVFLPQTIISFHCRVGGWRTHPLRLVERW